MENSVNNNYPLSQKENDSSRNKDDQIKKKQWSSLCKKQRS